MEATAHAPKVAPALSAKEQAAIEEMRAAGAVLSFTGAFFYWLPQAGAWSMRPMKVVEIRRPTCWNGNKMQNSKPLPLDSTRTFLGLKPSGNKSAEQKRRIQAYKLAAYGGIQTLPVAGGKPWGSLMPSKD